MLSCSSWRSCRSSARPGRRAAQGWTCLKWTVAWDGFFTYLSQLLVTRTIKKFLIQFSRASQKQSALRESTPRMIRAYPLNTIYVEIFFCKFRIWQNLNIYIIQISILTRKKTRVKNGSFFLRRPLWYTLKRGGVVPSLIKKIRYRVHSYHTLGSNTLFPFQFKWHLTRTTRLLNYQQIHTPYLTIKLSKNYK